MDGLGGCLFTKRADHISTKENLGCIGRVWHVFWSMGGRLIEKRLYLFGIDFLLIYHLRYALLLLVCTKRCFWSDGLLGVST